MDLPPQPEPTSTPPTSSTAASGLPGEPQPATEPQPAEPGTAATGAEPPVSEAPVAPEPRSAEAEQQTSHPHEAAAQAPHATAPVAGFTAPGTAASESHTVPHLDAPQPVPTHVQQQWATYEQGVTQPHLPRPTFYDPDATPTFGTRVPRPPKPADPFAVALGNASLLGVGYVLLGRKGLAVVAGLVTVTLLFLLLSVTPTLWFELVILAWWVAVVAHGWALARSRPRPGHARTQRFVALGTALPVLLAFGFLRFDAAGIEQDTANARADGDCAAALDATGKLWFGHELADAPLTERAAGTVRACDRLRTADRKLDAALGGDTDALAAGFGDLRGVLGTMPGHEEMVRSTVDGFLRALPVDDPCDTKAITDWLGKEKPRGAVLGEANAVVSRVAPDAIVGCADFFMARSDWQSARQRYQQLLDQYPDHELAPKAQAGATKATHAIELNNVRTLLTAAAGSTPAYCDKPAPYSAAKPYVPNAPNRALVFGNDAHTGKIPPGWKAKDAADAVVVICAGKTGYGTPVETCPYEAPESIAGFTDVTFHKIAIPLRVFEVRTGRLVASFTVEIGGASCPAVLEYTSYSYVDLGPPSQVHVAASIPDVQGAFRPLLIP